MFLLGIFKPANCQYLPLENEAVLKWAFHVTTFTREINTNEAMEHPRVVRLIYSHIQKNSNCCGRLLNLAGKYLPGCICAWVNKLPRSSGGLLTSLQSFVAIKKKHETCEWTRGSRERAEGVLLMRAEMVNLPRVAVLLYASDGWVIPADGEEPHQSPCPPTLSLGMMRSSEPCFRNTFPAQRKRRHRVKDHRLMEGFTANAAHQSPAGSDRAAGTLFHGLKGD